MVHNEQCATFCFYPIDSLPEILVKKGFSHNLGNFLICSLIQFKFWCKVFCDLGGLVTLEIPYPDASQWVQKCA